MLLRFIFATLLLFLSGATARPNYAKRDATVSWHNSLLEIFYFKIMPKYDLKMIVRHLFNKIFGNILQTLLMPESQTISYIQEKKKKNWADIISMNFFDIKLQLFSWKLQKPTLNNFFGKCLIAEAFE